MYEWLFFSLMLNILLIFIRIFLGIVFIFSGISKLFPIEYFDLILLEIKWIPVWSIPFLSRFIIGAEILLGLFIFLNFNPKHLILKTILIVLIGFSALMVYQWIGLDKSDNCGCFGDLISFSPKESLLKNIMLMLITGVLLAYTSAAKFKKWWLSLPIFIACLASPFIIEPFSLSKSTEATEMGYLDFKSISGLSNIESAAMEKGRWIIPIFSANCIHCRRVAKQLNILAERKPKNQIHSIIIGSEAGLQDFMDGTEFDLPYTWQREIDYFLMLTEGRFPTVFEVIDGKINRKWVGSSINFTELEKILSE